MQKIIAKYLVVEIIKIGLVMLNRFHLFFQFHRHFFPTISMHYIIIPEIYLKHIMKNPFFQNTDNKDN